LALLMNLRITTSASPKPSKGRAGLARRQSATQERLGPQRGGTMVAIGYTMMCEQRSPKDLVDDLVFAEQAGFDFSVISDHYHPWLEVQAHSPYAWAVLGAAAQATTRIPLMTYVTCPTIRYHPAVVAQKAATLALLSDGRFRLGLGAGEQLNEHVVGRGWPSVTTRHQMLSEAVDIIRRLWEGGYVTCRGRHFAVQDAKLFDRPATPPRLGLAASGRASCALAGQKADLLIATEPKAELVRMFGDAGGAGKPAVAQIAICWGPSEDKCRAIARDQFRWAATGWKVQAELPNPVSFDAGSRFVRNEDIAELVPCGPSVDGIVEGVGKFVEAGFDEVALLQIGDRQRELCDFYASDLAPSLRALSV
jgi:G6PDH family F420-dependent oxidoreductase